MAAPEVELAPKGATETPTRSGEASVRGAFGTLRDTHFVEGRRPSWGKRIFAFLVVMGPGIIVVKMKKKIRRKKI
jgi:hypothetical protein